MSSAITFNGVCPSVSFTVVLAPDESSSWTTGAWPQEVANRGRGGGGAQGRSEWLTIRGILFPTSIPSVLKWDWNSVILLCPYEYYYTVLIHTGWASVKVQGLVVSRWESHLKHTIDDVILLWSHGWKRARTCYANYAVHSRVPLCMVLCYRQETRKPQFTMVGFDRGATLHSTSRENMHPQCTYSCSLVPADTVHC